MWVGLFLCLLLAHLVADFILQTSSSCNDKAVKHGRSLHQYIHALIVFGLSWLVSWDLSFWWCALVIGSTHLLIDIWKSYKEEDIKWFSLDQLFHCLVLAVVAIIWSQYHSWAMPGICSLKLLAALISILICWKPANFFIKLMLKHFSVNMPEQEEDSRFNAGALIGNVERWLILVFVYLGRYEALGLLIAAKSIIRFSESQTNKTEYVLAGTLMSILIAVLCGLFVVGVEQIVSYLSI